MILGALIDAGLSLEALEKELQSLGVTEWKFVAAKEMRGAFAATRLRVLIDGGGSADPPDRLTPTQGPGSAPHAGAGHSHEHSHGQSHEHFHGPSHEHSHEHFHGQGATHTSEPSQDSAKSPAARGGTAASGAEGHRGLAEILRLIDRSGLPDAVKSNAGRVFQRLGEAEARVHGVPVETIHFHEVGAVDSIVDIVGCCLGFHMLGVDTIHCAPITVGTGFVNIAHGRVPLPAPATLELLRGFPIEHRDSSRELTTPTGAAVLTTLATGFGPAPPMTVRAVGYGAGDPRPGPIPNVLRVILGDATPAAARAGSAASLGAACDRVVVLESNVDDMSPQWTGYLLERLLEAGALDVSVAPLLMKKSRPAHELKVIVRPELERSVLAVLFRESTTFGVRRQELERVVLERESRSVSTPWGAVRVKMGRLDGEVITATPEFEDLKAAAARAKMPLKELHAWVMAELERPAKMP